MHSIAHAAPNYQINYQGKLTNASDIAVADGTYHMKFRLYTAETGGSNIWEDNRSSAVGDRIGVTDGLFSVMLGSSTALTSVNFNQTLYLEVEVGGTSSTTWETLSPRKRLGTVPAAFEADKLDGVDSASFVRSDEADTISLTDNSNPALTITQSGTGNVLDLFDGGTKVFSVLDGGNVGIGTSTPFSRLSVHAAAGESSMSVGSSTATYFMITSSGSVGIGTSSPLAKLHVAGTIRGDTLALGTTTDTTLGLRVSHDGVLLNGGTLKEIVDVRNTAGTSGVTLGYDTAVTKGFLSSVGTNSGLALVTHDGSSWGERLSIGTTGNVGIGTTSPYAKFSLHKLSTDGNPTGDLFAIATSTPTATTTVFRINFQGSTFGNNFLSTSGSALSPSFRWESDDDTGFYNFGADSIGIATGGNFRAIVDGSGNFGIATSTPWGLLSVNPNGISGPAFVVGSSTGTNLIVTNGGLVGIGTTTPSANLVVNGTTGRNLVQVATSTNQNVFVITQDGKIGLGTSTPLVGLHSTRGIVSTGQVGSFSGVFRSDSHFEARSPDALISIFDTTNPTSTTSESAIAWGGYDGAGSPQKTASISAVWSSTSTVSGYSALRLNATKNGGGTDAIGLTIYGGQGAKFFGFDFTGPGEDKLLIGGEVQAENMSIGTTFDSTLGLKVYHNGATFDGNFKEISEFRNAAGTNGLTLGYDNTATKGVITSVGTNSGLALVTHDGSSWGERLSIGTTGNVGIGTTSPYAKFSLHKLSTDGNPTGDLFAIATSTPTATTTVFRINFQGNTFGTTFLANDGTALSPSFRWTNDDDTGLYRFGANSIGIATGGNFSAVVDGSGRLGIGTSTPNWLLQTVGTRPFSVLSDTAAGTNAKHWFTTSQGGNYYIGTSSDALNATTTYMTILGGGDVGIGTVSPAAKLHVFGSIRGDALALGTTVDTGLGIKLFHDGSTFDGNFKEIAEIRNAAGTKGVILGYDTSAVKGIMTSVGANSGIGFVTHDGSSWAERISIATNGNVGIASTSPWRTLSVNGTVAFNGLTTSATGNSLCILSNKDITDAGAATCTGSSERFKENIATLQSGLGLDLLKKIRVVSFDYKKEYASPEEAPASIGFIAEETETVDTRFVDYGYDGKPLTIHFERILAITAQAVQELWTIVEQQQKDIQNLFTRVADLEHKQNQGAVEGDTLCIGSTCVTEEQLKTILMSAGQESALSSSGASAETSTTSEPTPDTIAPTLTISGNNPAEIALNATYNDLGVVVQDNVDNNLGHTITVDGTLLASGQQVTIDTSVAGEHAIVYSATDNAGNTASSTRTVIVGGEEEAPAVDEAADETATTTDQTPSEPATADTATTTDETL